MTNHTAKYTLSSIIIGLFCYSNALAISSNQHLVQQLQEEGWSKEEIKQEAKNLGLDIDYIFSGDSNKSTEDITTYISKSCKSYDIKYINILDGYTSDNLKSKEYFINTDYFKKYVDSKNLQKSGCTNNYISISQYIDNSNSTERFIAPNGKIYFIMNDNGQYTSYELNSNRMFNSIYELKNFIKNRNPLSN